MKVLFNFIEEAICNHQSCLVVSYKNKCCTVAIAVAYLLFKFNWSISRSLEMINARKIEIELTKKIIKQLRQLEIDHETIIKERQNMKLRRNW